MDSSDKPGAKAHGGLRGWVEARWPLTATIGGILDEEIPGGARYAYVFGSATLFVFVLQVVTGVWQILYYVPTVDHAYESVTYLRLHVPFGWLIHGLHYWGANAFIALIGLHVIQVFIWGAYKKPRELVWLLGVVLMVLAAMLMFTGALLPWDMMGYWAADVGTSISATMPGVGEYIKWLMRGGETIGQLSLSRFFAFHIALIPGLTVLFIVLHLVALRKSGSAGPWKRAKTKPDGRFWPDQAFKDLLVIIVVLLALIGLSVYMPAPFTGPADPLDPSYIPKPEWNFLFLYQALKAFPGQWEQVSTVGVPTLIFLLLVLLPFIDRSPERSPGKRKAVIAGGALFVGGIMALTVLGYNSTVELGEPSPSSGATITPVSSAPESHPATVPAGPSAAQIDTGKQLFVSLGCAACHSTTGAGGTLGPDLSLEVSKGRSRAWLLEQMRNPKANNPNSIMPPFANLEAAQTGAMVDFLLSLSAPAPTKARIATTQTAPEPPTEAAVALPLSGQQGPAGIAAAMVGSPEHGHVLFNQFCLYCHGDQSKAALPNPGSEAGKVPSLWHLRAELVNPDPLRFAQNLDRFVQHGSRPKGTDARLLMPAFGAAKVLSQPQIANIEAYLMSVNGVDRAKIIDAGVDPRAFFMSAVAVFALAGLVMMGLWIKGASSLR